MPTDPFFPDEDAARREHVRNDTGEVLQVAALATASIESRGTACGCTRPQSIMPGVSERQRRRQRTERREHRLGATTRRRHPLRTDNRFYVRSATSDGGQGRICGTVRRATRADDQFGGPEPDDAHLTGVILRLNADGTTPQDNPFFAAGANVGGEVGRNIQKIFAYGLRNGFGMAFDPVSGRLWEQENGDDSFSELNLVAPGFNSGWVQIMGPVNRIAQFKAIETTQILPTDPNAPTATRAAELRWSPVNIADRSQQSPCSCCRCRTTRAGGCV